MIVQEIELNNVNPALATITETKNATHLKNAPMELSQ
jgi:hypothetical protein